MPRSGSRTVLAASPTQDPQLVAAAMVALVEGAPGTRPFRTTVDNLGMGEHVASYNEHLHSLTAGVLGNFGLGAMLARRGAAVGAAA